LFTPRLAFGQACCSSGTPTELAALATSDDAVVLGQLGYEQAFGSANQDSRYRALTGSAARDGTLTFAGGVRLFPRDLQLGVVVPLRLQHRWLRDVGSSTEAGVGDSAVALRYRVLESDRFVPSIDFILGLRIPTGKSPEDSSDPTLADATGAGSWVPSLGARLGFELTPLDTVFVRGEYGLTLERDAAGRRLDPGDELTLELGYVRSLSLTWFAGALVDVHLTGETETDGRNDADSDSRRMRLGVWLTWLWQSPTWDSTLALFSDPYFSGPEKNVPLAGLATTLSVRRLFR
jgi:hypothetical protein